jgi:IS605 OrfB family transposase
MKAARTTKLKLTSDNPRLSEVSIAYLQAANWLSKIIFQRNHIDTPNSLSREFYGIVRNKFRLPSQVTCSLFRHVVASYRSMKSNGEWRLAVYKKPVVPICWKRDFNIARNKLTIWGVPTTYQSGKIPKGFWADSKLKLIHKQWFLILTINIDIPEPKIKGTILGVDSGQKNLLTAIEPKSNKTLYIRGKELNHRRLCIRQTRAKVASVGSRSAYRLLKRLSGTEKAVTQQMLHTASKQLVAFAESVNANTIVMEDLTCIRNSKKPMHHKQKARNHRWPFTQCQFFISYKAAAKGIGIEYVDPRNTSRGCPKCGHTEKANRNGLAFQCVSCGYQDNADRNGAINIASRLLLQRQAVEERAFVSSAYSSHEDNCVSELQAPTFQRRGN